MFSISRLWIFALLFSFASAEVDYPGDDGPQSKDEEILREWLELKRIEPLREKKAQLSVSGVVRTMLRASSARRQNRALGVNRGLYGGAQGYPSHAWINCAALYFDYSAYLAWAHAKIKYENNMGSLGGSADSVTLEEGYLGYRILEDGKSLFDMFIGRTKLYTLFDSAVQYNAILDGLVLRYENDYSGWGHLQGVWAGTLMTAATNHYGWTAQLSFTKLFSTGLYVRFSFSDWERKAPTLIYGGDGEPTMDGAGSWAVANNNPQFAYHIAQYLIGYEGQGRLPFRLYSAFLLNHGAHVQPALNFNRRQNVAWYVGGSIGKIRRRGDMAFNLCYQYVGAQSVPGWDMAGIGLGNPGGSTFYYPALTGDPAPFGNTNFKGIEANYLLGLSPEVAFLIKYQVAHSAVKVSGWASRYQRLELSALYAF